MKSIEFYKNRAGILTACCAKKGAENVRKDLTQEKRSLFFRAIQRSDFGSSCLLLSISLCPNFAGF